MTESRRGPGAGGRVYGDPVSVWEGEKVRETEGGAGHTITGMCLRPLSSWLTENRVQCEVVRDVYFSTILKAGEVSKWPWRQWQEGDVSGGEGTAPRLHRVRGSSGPAGEPREVAAEKCQQASKNNALPDLSRSGRSRVPPASRAAPQTPGTSTLSVTDSAPRASSRAGRGACSQLRPLTRTAPSPSPRGSSRHLGPASHRRRGPSTPRDGGLQRSEGKARKRRGCSSRRTASPGKTLKEKGLLTLAHGNLGPGVPVRAGRGKAARVSSSSGPRTGFPGRVTVAP